jgi:hypothetical protein
LIQSNLNANTGTVTARSDTGDKCPNCNSGLWRVTYRDAYAEVMKRFEEHITAPPSQDAEDAARFLWYFTGDRGEGMGLVDLMLRVIEGERPPLDEWRSAIDAARKKEKQE